jgi:hypothetical protein
VWYEPRIRSWGNHPVLVRAGQRSWVDPDTGKAQIPLAAAAAGRSLPALPGQRAFLTPEAGPGTRAFQDFLGPGTLGVTIILESRQEKP